MYGPCPNSQQLMRHYRTALAAAAKAKLLQATFPIAVWQPTTPIGFAVGCLGFFLVIRAISAAPDRVLVFPVLRQGRWSSLPGFPLTQISLAHSNGARRRRTRNGG